MLNTLYNIIILEIFTIFHRYHMIVTMICDLCNILCDRLVTVVTMTSY